ncbi:MAG: hypothetical protein WDA37_07120 [Dysgonamonadaceae bacterium]|jgi:hypothetical protein
MKKLITFLKVFGFCFTASIAIWTMIGVLLLLFVPTLPLPYILSTGIGSGIGCGLVNGIYHAFY